MSGVRNVRSQYRTISNRAALAMRQFRLSLAPIRAKIFFEIFHPAYCILRPQAYSAQSEKMHINDSGLPTWDIQAARNLYNIQSWGARYFDVNEAGHVIARPLQEA